MSDSGTEIRAFLGCIKQHGPITAEQIAQKTEYVRYVVDVALPLMIEHGMIYQSGVTQDEWKDPVYQTRLEVW